VQEVRTQVVSEEARGTENMPEVQVRLLGQGASEVEELVEVYREAFRLAYAGYDYHYLRNLHLDYNSQIDANAIHDASKFTEVVLKTHNYPKHHLKPSPLLRRQDYRIEGNRISLIFRPRNRLVLGIYPSQKQLKLMEQGEVKGARLVQRGGRYFLNVVVKKEVQLPDPSECETFIGVDIGINYLAVCSAFDGEKFSNPLFFGGGEWRHLCDRKRKIMSGSKEFRHLTRRQHEIIHTVSKRIVEYAKQFPKPVIVLEWLGNFENDTENHRFNFLLGNWARGKLQRMIEYKAKWEGIPVVYVSPAYTSQTCHYCGSEGTREGLVFRCQNCGRTYNADANACMNIAKRFWQSVRQPSDDPKGMTGGCSGGDLSSPSEGETCLPSQTNARPNGKQMDGMMVTRTVSLPLAVGGG
jgi:IS605 OrfB family transposase